MARGKDKSTKRTAADKGQAKKKDVTANEMQEAAPADSPVVGIGASAGGLAALAGSFVRPGRFEISNATKHSGFGIRKMAEKQLLKYFAPCAVVVNRHMEVLHFLGDTSFLQIPDGEPTTNLIAMLSPLYRNPVRSLVHDMIDKGEGKGEVVLGKNRSGECASGRVEVSVRRLLGIKDDEPLYLAVFRELPAPSLPAGPAQDGEACGLHDQIIRQLEEELQFSHLSLGNTIEQLEATNEELESSREELQALNEELSAVYTQLEDKAASLEQSESVALEASRRAGFLTLLTDALPVRMAYIDTEERLRYANELYYAWLDLPREKVLGKTLQEVLGNKVYGKIKPYIKGALAGERSSFEAALEYKGAGYREVLAECAPHFDDHGKVTGVFGVILDLSPRKEAERNNAWLAAIVRSSGDAIISKNFNGTVLSWNRAAEQIYGYSAREMIGANIDRIYPGEETAEDIKAILEELRQGRLVPPFETKRRRKDGTVIDVLLTLSPILESNDNPVAVSVLARDISLRKREERELQELNRTLERKVEERTSSLEQHMVQLRRVAMELTQSEQRERERLSKILHDDMQQLLVAAGLRLERLESHLQVKKQQDILQDAVELLDKASSVARSLATDLRPPELSGASLVEGLRWLMEWIWQRFDLAVHLEISDNFNPSSLPAELGAYLLGAIRELLFNIVKHAQVKTARVKVSLDSRQCLVFTVMDHGVGSEKLQIDQLEDVAKGMGLRSIRERIELMGGTFTISTASGKGFRVDILFPYPLTADNHGSCLPESGASGEDSKTVDEAIKVMLVDDHRLIRDGLRMVLEDEEGLKVVAEADNGKQAVQLAAESRPDVIIMDINMPVLNGIEATRQIKEQAPNVSVIGLSVDGDASLVRSMVEAGACAYLQKDGPAEELLRTVRGCFEEKRRESTAEDGKSCRPQN